MPPELEDLTDAFVNLTPMAALGIPIALVGAVLLAIGAQFQHRGVGKVEAATGEIDPEPGLGLKQLGLLLKRPSWLIGMAITGLAIAVQLFSLYLSPLIVVQPLGAIALVCTALINSRIARVRLDATSIRAIVMCVAGVGLFVTFAAFVASSRPVGDQQLGVILALLGIVTVGLSMTFVLLRSRFTAIGFTVGAGVLYGFVVTLAKVVIDRTKTGDFEWLTVLCIAGLLAAAVLGGYFVQNAYASGPPDLVMAGLTVIDPIVAVLIGVVVLQEAAGAPLFTLIAFLAAGAVAVAGVFLLARHHPQLRRDEAVAAEPS